ncbi:Enterochelin esterase-like enzyme [Frankia sp. AiPs1]|uniref:alpha/beta hydrolase n=1 Tax=Frankia sp. AiPa1 TaxID=573492 RepID=UPI00202ADCBA|nr:alpha/beta hydrolase-fold protein [Frankia sp. AiPa1]MCL9759676.1 alpha/beta hydrolase-fold protein [Frankia sp. AiPa1]
MGSLVIIGKWFLLTLGALTAAAWLGCALAVRRLRRGRPLPVKNGREAQPIEPAPLSSALRSSAPRRPLARQPTPRRAGRRYAGRDRSWSGRLLLAGAGGLAVTLTLATAADLVNAHYSYLPRLDDVLGVHSWPTASSREAVAATPIRTHPQGSVVSLAVPGVHSGFGTQQALVYLPPQYFTEPRVRFPVVYLMHGSPGVPVDWYRANRAAQTGAWLAGHGRPVILVAPRLSNGWLDDSECVDRPSEHIETYVVDDVIPTVDARLRSRPDRADRIFAGMSAGGFCALNLGLRHRDLVGTIIDMSGMDRPTHDGGMIGLFGHRPDLSHVVAANTPAVYAAHLPATPPMRVWLDCGRGDRESYSDTRYMAATLGARPGFQVELRLRPGGHDFGVWRPALRDGLAWALEVRTTVTVRLPLRPATTAHHTRSRAVRA